MNKTRNLFFCLSLLTIINKTKGYCGFDCSICDDDVCTACKTEHYLERGDCRNCDFNCKVCIDRDNCVECVSGYKLSDGECNKNLTWLWIFLGCFFGIPLIIFCIVVVRQNELEKRKKRKGSEDESIPIEKIMPVDSGPKVDLRPQPMPQNISYSQPYRGGQMPPHNPPMMYPQNNQMNPLQPPIVYPQNNPMAPPYYPQNTSINVPQNELLPPRSQI